MKINETILKQYTIFWDNEEKVLVALQNEKMDYILRLRKEFEKYQNIPANRTVDVYELFASDRNTMTVDEMKKRTVAINVLRPEIIPISTIDLS